MDELKEKIAYMIAKIVYEDEFDYAIQERGAETTINEIYGDFKDEIDGLINYIDKIRPVTIPSDRFKRISFEDLT